MGRLSEMDADLREAERLAAKHGGRLSFPPSPDEIVSNHMGGALLSLKLARDAVRDGGHYRPSKDGHHPCSSFALAIDMLGEIQRSMIVTRDEEAA